MPRPGHLFALVLLLVLAPSAFALDAIVGFNLNNGTTLAANAITLPQAGNCTGCNQLPAGLNLTPDRNKPPIVIEVASAPGGTAVTILAFGTKDCSGANSTATFFDFASGSVSIDTSSGFPGYVESFGLCTAQA